VAFKPLFDPGNQSRLLLSGIRPFLKPSHFGLIFTDFMKKLGADWE